MVNIDQEHPDYKLRKGMWRTYRDLYAGGEQLKANAHLYLTRRHKEAPDVYGERISRVFYENYIGTIIDWYAATLFRREPNLSFWGDNEAARAFFCEFAEDCDRKQTAISDFFRCQFVEMLVTGASYILVDFPGPNGNRLTARRRTRRGCRALTWWTTGRRTLLTGNSTARGTSIGWYCGPHGGTRAETGNC